MSLEAHYQVDEGVYLTVSELRVGQVVFVSNRIWEYGRVEAVGADWAVIRLDEVGPWMMDPNDIVDGTKTC